VTQNLEAECSASESVHTRISFSGILFCLDFCSLVTQPFLVQEFFGIRVASIFLQENDTQIGDFLIQVEVALLNGTYLEPSNSAC
jgi:hypothetical protein